MCVCEWDEEGGEGGVGGGGPKREINDSERGMKGGQRRGTGSKQEVDDYENGMKWWTENWVILWGLLLR